MADDAVDPNKPTDRAPDALVTYWLSQIDAYDREFENWTKACRKIIKRYRDERSEQSDGMPSPSFRFNALWSNVQTLAPAIYIKPPKPVAERRFLDKDPLARLASMTLERSLEVQIEVGGLHPSMQKSVLDYLLVGRGTTWERYEPTYGEAVDTTEQPAEGESTDARKDEGEAPRPVTYEKVCTDYIAWDKFKHSVSPVWEDVWWVGKEDMLTRKELQARFKEKDKETGKPIADLVPLQSEMGRNRNSDGRYQTGKRPNLARVVEIWNKRERKVIFIAPDWPNAPLEIRDDPLNLESFWPCPKPLYATTTNDTLVPVPDYKEYQDQADELDNLTSRINALTDAVRVNGVYDASYPELKRILAEGVENRMIGVKNYSEFASKGGLEGAMDFVPIKDVVEALVRLYEARDRTKADMAEITGLSDIIRGQAQGTAKTATEQRIKGQFASLRLEDRKKEVSRFACDIIRIAAEIISEQFSPEILSEMTGMIPFITEEIKSDPPPQPAMMGHNGGPPMQAAPGVSPPQGNGAPGAVPPPGAGMQPDPKALAEQKFQEICALLRDDKMRTFRIDIETDSTVEADKQAAKDSVVELFTAVGGFLEKALPIGQAMPQLTPALGQSILFAFRRFGAGRDVEAVWEQAIDQLTQMAKNPPPKPPSPEQVKADADKAKAEMDMQVAQGKAALDQQKGQQDLAFQQQKAQIELQQAQAQLQIDQQKLQLEREKMGMEREKAAMGLQVEQQRMTLDTQAAERDAALGDHAAMRDNELADRAAERDAESGEQQFELGKKTAAFKAKEAMKPKPKVKA